MFIGRFVREIEVSMYAVIRTGGKQVRVAEGDVVRVERHGDGRRRARNARTEAPRLQEKAPEGFPAHPRTSPGSRRDPHRVHYGLIRAETKRQWHTKKVRVRPATGATAT